MLLTSIIGLGVVDLTLAETLTFGCCFLIRLTSFSIWLTISS